MDLDARLLIAAICALLIRGGIALHEMGMLRAKNSASAIVRHLADLCIACLVFWAAGSALFHLDPRQLFAHSIDGSSRTALVLASALLASAIAAGAIAERSRLVAAYALPILLAGLLVPLCGGWLKSGWLARLGAVDVAGAGFIHMVGGLAAAAAAVIVGPRMGKYNRDGSASGIPGHSLPLAACGVLIALAAWPGMLAGWAAIDRHASPGLAALQALLAAAAGGLASLLYSHHRYGKPDAHLLLGGILGGLVAISAGAGVVPAWAAVVIGLVAGLLVSMATLWIELVRRIDDPTTSIAMHAVGGTWGMLASGIFAPAASWTDRLTHTGVQLLAIAVIAAITLAATTLVFAALARLTPLRAKEADEFDGLDLAEHDIGAYPDFQQNTIKSYHLREA